MDWLDLLAVQGTLKSLLQHHSSKTTILRCSAFFTVQLSHSCMTTGKTIALTRWTFVGKVMSLLFNMLSKLVIAFLPRRKHLLISWLQSPSAVRYKTAQLCYQTKCIQDNKDRNGKALVSFPSWAHPRNNLSQPKRSSPESSTWMIKEKRKKRKKKIKIYSNLCLFSVSIKGDASLIRPLIHLKRVKLKTRLTEQCSVFSLILRTPGL